MPSPDASGDVPLTMETWEGPNGHVNLVFRTLASTEPRPTHIAMSLAAEAQAARREAMISRVQFDTGCDLADAMDCVESLEKLLGLAS